MCSALQQQVINISFIFQSRKRAPLPTQLEWTGRARHSKDIDPHFLSLQYNRCIKIKFCLIFVYTVYCRDNFAVIPEYTNNTGILVTEKLTKL